MLQQDTGRVKSFNPDSLSRNCPVACGGRAPAGPCPEARVAVLGCRGGQARGLQPVAPRPCPASHSPWTSREAGPCTRVGSQTERGGVAPRSRH